MRPPALIRGPSAKPSVWPDGASRTPATSISAARPGRWRAASAFRPWRTSARFGPVSGTTSHTVASATRSSSGLRSGSALAAKRPRRRSSRCIATQARKATPAAQSCLSPDAQSGRFGFTAATTRGGATSALWWSRITTSARPRAASSASWAAMPQSTQTISVCPAAASRAIAGALGP